MVETTESSFSAKLLERFKAKTAQAGDTVVERIRDERRADMTEAEKNRRRKGEPKVQLNMRVTKETSELAHELAMHLDKSIPEMIALALAAFATSTPGLRRMEETRLGSTLRVRRAPASTRRRGSARLLNS
jgi:hypothetical protein